MPISATSATNVDATFLERTLELAENGSGRGDGGPFGAVVAKDGRVIAEAWNTVVHDHDPTAHAEINAIRLACEKLGTFHLAGCTLYASSEPCPMCLSAAYWARVERIVFANGRSLAASIGFSDEDLYVELAHPIAKRRIPTQQVHLAQAEGVLEKWFQNNDRVTY